MGPHQATRRTCRLTWPFQAGSSTYPGIDGMPFGGRLKGSRVRTLAARLLYSVAHERTARWRCGPRDRALGFDRREAQFVVPDSVRPDFLPRPLVTLLHPPVGGLSRAYGRLFGGGISRCRFVSG